MELNDTDLLNQALDPQIDQVFDDNKDTLFTVKSLQITFAKCPRYL